jgi:hypothetical protein
MSTRAALKAHQVRWSRRTLGFADFSRRTGHRWSGVISRASAPEARARHLAADVHALLADLGDTTVTRISRRADDAR